MQHTLARSPCTFCPARGLSASRRLSVAARANGEGPSKVVREFREDSGEMVVPGQEKAAEKALYADQLPPAMQKKENLSKEMKQRLRQEYYGLGGAENKAMSSNYFLWIILVVSVLAVLSKLTGAI